MFAGKLGSEEESKEEFRMEREPPATHEEGTTLSVLQVGAGLTFRVTCSLSGVRTFIFSHAGFHSGTSHRRTPGGAVVTAVTQSGFRLKTASNNMKQ